MPSFDRPSASLRWPLISALFALGAALLGSSRRAVAHPPRPPLAFAPPDGPAGPPPDRSDGPAPRKKSDATAEAPRLLPSAITIASIHLRELVAIDSICAATPGRARTIDWVLRDRTNWQSLAIDDRTLDAVLSTCRRFGATRVEVISGYRSSKMNEMLRKKGRHVAQRSQHPMATAVDFRLVGVTMEPVFRQLEREHEGGVGRYRDDAFVHVDTGPRRRWRGE
jgi:uncharacterized protein YcbK (DUF882 family)